MDYPRPGPPIPIPTPRRHNGRCTTRCIIDRRILFSLVLLVTPVLLSAQLSVDEEIALEYARQSLSLLRDDLGDEAFLLAGRGIGFDETSSDLHYLRAVAGAEDQDRTLLSRSHLVTALALDTWRLVDRQDGIRSLLSLLMRIGDFEAAEELLPELSLRRPVDYRLSVQVLRVAGNFAAADELFSRGRRIYPHDVGLFRFGLSLDRVAEPAERLWLERHASRDDDYLAALLDFILQSSSVAERRELLERYFSFGGDHPMAYGAAVEAEVMGAEDISASDNDGATSALRRFIDAEAYRDRSALRLARQSVFGTPDDSLLQEAVASYSGTVVEDANRDSFSEGRMEVQNGRLSLWEVDRDTDGVPEWRIRFESGIPTEVEYGVPGGAFRVVYFDYPEVAAVTFLDVSGQPTYHLFPGSTDFFVVPPEQIRGVEPLELLTSTSTAETPSLLSPGLVAESAYLVDLHDAAGNLRSRIVVDGTEALRRFDDTTGTGRIDHVVEYDFGIPVAGVRDPDGDGYFEVTEQYVDGELALLLVDEDDDFSIEYSEVQGGGSEGNPSVYSWDLDQDGIVDIREIVVHQDRLLGEFSSSAAGVFDVTLEEVLKVFSP